MHSSRTFLSIWFGNFFEPFYSDREAVWSGIAEAAELGFNAGFDWTDLGVTRIASGCKVG